MSCDFASLLFKEGRNFELCENNFFYLNNITQFCFTEHSTKFFQATFECIIFKMLHTEQLYTTNKTGFRCDAIKNGT